MKDNGLCPKRSPDKGFSPFWQIRSGPIDLMSGY